MYDQEEIWGCLAPIGALIVALMLGILMVGLLIALNYAILLN